MCAHGNSVKLQHKITFIDEHIKWYIICIQNSMRLTPNKNLTNKKYIIKRSSNVSLF